MLADVFTTMTLYDNRETFIVYPFFSSDESNGVKKSLPRFEQCVKFLEENMRPALYALFSDTYYDKDTHDSAEAFAKDTIDDYITTIQIEDNEIKRKLIAKLRSINYSIMSPDEILNIPKIEGIYEELNVDGSESLFKLHLSMKKHARKLKLHHSVNWTEFLNQRLTYFQPVYFQVQNVLSKLLEI